LIGKHFVKIKSWERTYRRSCLGTIVKCRTRGAVRENRKEYMKGKGQGCRAASEGLKGICLIRNPAWEKTWGKKERVYCCSGVSEKAKWGGTVSHRKRKLHE